MNPLALRFVVFLHHFSLLYLVKRITLKSYSDGSLCELYLAQLTAMENGNFVNIRLIQVLLSDLQFGFVREIVILRSKAIQQYPTIGVHLQVIACS